MGASFPKNCLFPWQDLHRRLKHDSLGPSEPKPKRHLDWFSSLCTYNRTVSRILYSGTPLPPSKLPLPCDSGGSKEPLLDGGSDPHLIMVLSLPRVLNPNGISIGSAVFAWLTIMTDRQTDRQTDHATWSVIIGRIYVYVVRAMWPNNNKWSK